MCNGYDAQHPPSSSRAVSLIASKALISVRQLIPDGYTYLFFSNVDGACLSGHPHPSCDGVANVVAAPTFPSCAGLALHVFRTVDDSWWWLRRILATLFLLSSGFSSPPRRPIGQLCGALVCWSECVLETALGICSFVDVPHLCSTCLPPFGAPDVARSLILEPSPPYYLRISSVAHFPAGQAVSALEDDFTGQATPPSRPWGLLPEPSGPKRRLSRWQDYRTTGPMACCGPRRLVRRHGISSPCLESRLGLRPTARAGMWEGISAHRSASRGFNLAGQLSSARNGLTMDGSWSEISRAPESNISGALAADLAGIVTWPWVPSTRLEPSEVHRGRVPRLSQLGYCTVRAVTFQGCIRYWRPWAAVLTRRVRCGHSAFLLHDMPGW